MEDDNATPKTPEVNPTTVEILLHRFDQLNDAHYEHNQVIHTTFYLSVVFFAGLLSIVFTTDPEGSLVPLLSFFASIVFLFLGVWAWRYNHGREEIKHRKQMIREELQRLDLGFSGDFNIDDTFFVRHTHTADPYKKIIHTSYYILLAILSFSIPLLVF